MASFLDDPKYLTNFNPYIQQLPVNEMVSVGTWKQGRYDEGVQKIQASIDRVAGLDVMRDVDKQYLQSKLDELGNNLKTVASGDFSNYQLVNSTMGMANKIGKDRHIVSAISSTSKARKEMDMMEADRKAGKLDPSNEYAFSKSLSGWINDPTVGASFNGSYIPHFDIFKFAKETFDEVLPDGMTFDQIYQLGADGKPLVDEKGNLIYSPTMTRMEKEGRLPEKVKQTIQQIFSDPRVSQQLNISGQYIYRGTDPNGLKGILSSQRSQLVNSYEEKIKELTIQKNLGKDVQREIDDLKSRITTTNITYNRYASSADTSPDAIRGMLYADDVNNRYSTMFGQTKTKEQVMENPAWRAMFDMQKEANAQSRWAQDLAWDKEKFAADAELKMKLASMKGKGKTGKEGEELLPADQYEQGNQPSNWDIIKTQASDYDNAVADFSKRSNDFLFQMMYSKDGVTQQKIDQYKNRGMTHEGAVEQVIKEEAAKNKMSVEEYRTKWIDKATSEYDKLPASEKERNPIISNAYRNLKTAKRVYESQLDIQSKVDAFDNGRLGKTLNQISLTNIAPQKITYDGKEYNISKQDIIDIALYANSPSMIKEIGNPHEAKLLKTQADLAFKRIQQRGNEDLIKFYENRESGDLYYQAKVGAPSLNKGADWSQVDKISKIITSKVFTEGLDEKAEVIKNAYGVKPNLKTGILTGKAEHDQYVVNELARFVGNYKERNQNLSHDFKKFSVDPEAIKKSRLEATVIMDENNQPKVEIVEYDNGGRKGGITLANDEARKLGIDINDIYEVPEVSALRRKVKSNNGKTCAGDPSDEATYVGNFDSYFDRNDFPQISKTDKYDVKVNIVEVDGKYYPYVYVSDGENKDVRCLEGTTSLSNLYKTLAENISPSLVEKILKEKNAGRELNQ